MKPLRLTVAQKVCRRLPPVVSEQVRAWLYPSRLAEQHAVECAVPAQTRSILTGNTADQMFYPFSVHGFYDFRNIAVASALVGPGNTVVEVGANVGTESVSYADLVGPSGVVHAFEPLPCNILRLKAASEQSRYRNIIVHPCALSNRDGHARFAVPDATLSGTGYIVPQSIATRRQTIEVELVRLDSLVPALGRAQLVAVDVEGEEVKFLEGADAYFRQYRPPMIIEASPRALKRAGSSIRGLFDALSSYGYRNYRIGWCRLRRIDVERETSAGNWLCLNEDDDKRKGMIARRIMECALFPCIAGLNPMTLRS